MTLALLLGALNLLAAGVTLRDPAGLEALAAQPEAGSSFTYYSVVFDGSNDYLTRGGDLTGVADSQSFAASGWLKFGGGDGVLQMIIRDNNSRFRIIRDSDNKLKLVGQDSGASEVIKIESSSTVTVSSGWTHFACGYDLGTSGRRYFYVNGSDVTVQTTFSLGATVDLASSNTEWDIGARPSGSHDFKLFASVCELWMDDVWLDHSVESNRLKFRTSGGKPENLGSDGSTPTGSQPLLYFRQEAPAWEVNLGSAGGFTENGALADGGSDKP